MKVIIIGAGLSGLCTAIALRKYITDVPLDLKIYDKPDHAVDPNATPEDQYAQRRRKLGAGLGLQSNGLHVLEDLDPKLREKAYASGFPCTHFKWMTDGNVLLGREYVDILPISRPLLIDDCLAQWLPEGSIQYKSVSKVIVQQGLKPTIQFEDGSTPETADLVVGADGVGSILRKALFGDEKKFRAQYLGICGVGGVLDIALPKHLLDDPSMNFFMGSEGVVGYTGLTQADKNKLLFWSIYQTELPEKGQTFDHELLTKQLRERHTGYSDPLIAECLQKAEVDNVYPVFVMPELPYWGRDGCVLVGDAGHALPPRSGQGSSQAFEDAQTLALLLGKHLQKDEIAAAVSKSIADVYGLRHKRVYNIRAKAMIWKDPKPPMTWWQTWLLYSFLFVWVRISNTLSFYKGLDKWDAKVEVEKYLARQN